MEDMVCLDGKVKGFGVGPGSRWHLLASRVSVEWGTEIFMAILVYVVLLDTSCLYIAFLIKDVHTTFLYPPSEHKNQITTALNSWKERIPQEQYPIGIKSSFSFHPHPIPPPPPQPPTLQSLYPLLSPSPSP